MPAEDRYHQTVAIALKKQGWTIEEKQVVLFVKERRLYIDLRASKATESLMILVEIKGFENAPSKIEYLAGAVGQYMLYIASLNFLKDTTPLYMAVPEAAYNGILSQEIGRLVIQMANIRLIVFNPVEEEIILWIPPPVKP